MIVENFQHSIVLAGVLNKAYPSIYRLKFYFAKLGTTTSMQKVKLYFPNDC